MNQKLKKRLDELDDSTEKMNERAILRKINEVTEADMSSEVINERIAFSVQENHKDKEGGWGTYLGPYVAEKGGDGQIYTCPGFPAITKGVIEYWEGRAAHTRNSIMKARYLGLVWDMKELVSGTRLDHKIGIDYIKTLISVCERNLCLYSGDSIGRITRAYQIACRLNNTDLIQSCIKCAIKLEDRIAEDDKPGLWGFCFELFVLDKSEHLSKTQKDKLISDLEDRLDRISATNSIWPCENASILLARYYQKNSRKDDVKRVLGMVGKCYEISCSSCAETDPLRAQLLYKSLYNIYSRFQLTAEAKAIKKKIADIGPDAVKGMKNIPFSTTLPKEDLDRFLEAITSGGLKQALTQIAVCFLPRKDEMEKNLRQSAEDHPLSYHISKKPCDDQGLPVAAIGGIDDDFDGNLIDHFSQHMVTAIPLLQHSFIKLKDQYTVTEEDIADYIFQSPIFDQGREKTILTGVAAFLNEDYIGQIHILIPEIEASVRTLVEILGGERTKANRQGGFQHRALYDLIRDDKLKAYFKDNHIDLSFYIRTLLTDLRGWNMRNKVCHGLINDDSFSYPYADRVMHVILLLALMTKDLSR